MGKKILTEEKKAALLRAQRGASRVMQVLVFGTGYGPYMAWRRTIAKVEGIRMKTTHGFLDEATNVFFDCVYIRKEDDYMDLRRHKNTDGNTLAVILSPEELHPIIKARLDDRAIPYFQVSLEYPVTWIDHV